MSSFLSKLVLNSEVLHLYKLLGTTFGREKLYRAFQYFFRFQAWSLTSRGFHAESSRWHTLRQHVAVSRKLIRLGRPIENLQCIAHMLEKPSVFPIERFAYILRHSSWFIFFSFDMLIWAHLVKFHTLSKRSLMTMNKIGNWAWVLAIVSGIVYQISKIIRLISEIQRFHTSASDKGPADDPAKACTLQRQLHTCRAELFCSCLDVFIPLSYLDVGLSLNDGILGLLGMITSVVTLYEHWQAIGPVMRKS